MAARAGPVDVTVFGDQRMRLYLRDNRTERRAFAGVGNWDKRERRCLAEALAAEDVDAGAFTFVDAGANVGLYTLWMRHAAARAGRDVRIAAVECDPVNLGRLEFNLAASGAGDEVSVHQVALGTAPGEAAFRTRGLVNRGEARLAERDGADTVRVPVAPLLAVLDEAGIACPDALKIDVEGAEAAILAAFLESAPQTRWPRLVVIEAGHGAQTPALARLCEAGYSIRDRTRMNVILAAPDESRSEAIETGGAHGQA